MKDLPERAREFSRPYRVAKGKGFHLRDVDPGDTAFLESADAERAKEAPQEGVEQLAGFHGQALRAGSRLAAARRELTGSGR